MLVNVLFSLLDSFKNVGTVGAIEHNGVSVKSRFSQEILTLACDLALRF